MGANAPQETSAALVGEFSTGNPARIAASLPLLNENLISVLVNIGTDFTVSLSPPSSNSLTAGQSATSTVALTQTTLFDNPVSVQPTQSGAPSCSLSSNSVTFDAGGKASATLTINAGSSVASRNHSQPFGGGLLWFPVAGFAFLGTGAGLSRKRKLLVLLIGGVLFVGLAMQLACGGGSSRPKSTAYTVTVTGSSGATQHSTSISLTVQ